MTANPGDPEIRADAPPTAPGRIPADTFSNRLLLTRALAGHLSIREAADLTGLNREAWRDWERGRRPRDILDVCRRIAEALDIDEHWLLFGGPLAGPRGMPTKRLRRDNDGYATVPVRPTDTRPPGRPRMAPRPDRMISPDQRRPVRIHYPTAA